MEKHILVISQYFYPEEFRINDICKEWINRGYKVTVVTGMPNYPKGKFYKGYGYFKKRKEIYNNIEIIRIPIIPRGSNSLMLPLNYLSFVISGFWWQLFSEINPDLLFVFQLSPVTQALPAIWFARRRKKPLILFVQDLWPESIEAVMNIDSNFIMGLLNKMVDFIYRQSDLILTTSKSFKKSIVSRGIDSLKVEYWPQYAEDFYTQLERAYANEIIQDNKFNITFTGNIGVAQGLQMLPEAAKLLIDKGIKDFRFNIIGDGRYKSDFLKLIKEENIEEYFVIIKRKPADKISEYLAMSDAAYLSLEKTVLFSKTIPAKLQSYLASGIPIIASASGETKKIIEESQTGVCSPAGDVKALAHNISKMIKKDKVELKQMGQNAIIYNNKEFNKNILLNKFDEFYNELS